MASGNDQQEFAPNRNAIMEGVRALQSINATLNLILDGVTALDQNNSQVSSVAALPAAGTAGAGARRMVNDATVTTFASIVAGGGANTVPVYSDGTDWRIG